MQLSLNINRLREHLNYLEATQYEVEILNQAVCEWRNAVLMSSGCDDSLFAKQIDYLSNQQKWIKERYQLIESIIEQFSEWYTHAENEFTESQRALDFLLTDI